MRAPIFVSTTSADKWAAPKATAARAREARKRWVLFMGYR
jgi:hypothetical protein